MLKKSLATRAFALALTLSVLLGASAAQASHRRAVQAVGTFYGTFFAVMGTIMTSDIYAPVELNVLGWSLIAGGILSVESAQLDAQAERYDVAQVYRPLMREAVATARHPELSEGRAISFAAKEFETDATGHERLREFAQLVTKVDAAAREIKRSGERADVHELSVSLLGERATEKNVHMVTNLFALSGVI